MVFNSRDTKYKTPFGAIAADREFTINFPLPEWVEGDVYIVFTGAEELTLPLDYSGTEDGYKFYSRAIRLSREGIYYYSFKVKSNYGEWRYFRDVYCNAVCDDSLPEWQLTVYKKTYKTPDFVKGGLIYHIFVDRFYRYGEVEARGRRLHCDWYENPVIADADGGYHADDFFGGNLKGITEKLEYIEGLGATVLYLSPIFESCSNHRYDTGDYMKVDPMLGTEDDLRELIERARDRGIAVILDGVFNHTGADSVYFNKFGRYDGVGACQSIASKYYSWYSFDSYPDKYKCWWGIDCVPTVNHMNPRYVDFIIGKGGVIEKWSRLGVAGWRLDVVDELPVEFVNRLVKKVKTLSKDNYVLGEVWEDASTKVSYGELRPYLIGNQLDGVMNYPFKDAVIDFVLGGDVNAFKLRVWSILDNYPKETMDVCMNMLSTHDTVRALSRLAPHDVAGTTKQQRLDLQLTPEERFTAKERLRLAALMQYTLPGVPSIFYGDEVGVEGYEDPINRRTYPWGKEDEGLLGFYRKLGRLRADNREVWYKGDFRIYDDNDVLAYSWTYGDKAITVVINNSAQWRYYAFKRAGKDYFTAEEVTAGEYALAPEKYLLIIGDK